MNNNEDFEFNSKNSCIVLFGFELNQTHCISCLILSLIGIVMIPFTLAGEILFNLFQTIFAQLPSYFRLPEEYHTNLWFYYYFSSHIATIIVYVIFLYFSIYTLKRILKTRIINNDNIKKVNQEDRIINWLGFKLSHSQSFFIFSLSLVGMLFTIEFYFEGRYLIYFDIYQSLCAIPIGPNSFVSHQSLPFIMSSMINLIFIIICIYSIVKTRWGKARKIPNKFTKNYGLLIYIISFIVFFISLIRFSCHLLFFTDLSYLLGTTPSTSNSYQINDFIKVVVVLIISIIFMISSYFLKEQKPIESKNIEILTWFRIKLTLNRAIILFSLAFLFIVFFCYLFIVFLFLTDIILRFPFSFIPLPIVILFCYYPIDKLLKRKRFRRFIDSMENSGEIITSWFKIPLTRLYSVVFFAASCGLLVILFVALISINNSILVTISGILTYHLVVYPYEIIAIPITIGFAGISIGIIINIIKKTLPSIKSRA